ncbi:oxidoreductase, partial [bacterium]|nr:oxidoreductase [bacterium]
FIIRAVNLLGIDLGRCPMPIRLRAWERLITDLPTEFFEQASREISLDEVPSAAAELLAGKGHGRVVVRL